MASWIPSWITGGSAEPHHGTNNVARDIRKNIRNSFPNVATPCAPAALKAVVAGLDKELDALRVLDVEVEKQVRHSNASMIGNICPACPGRSFNSPACSAWSATITTRRKPTSTRWSMSHAVDHDL
jgi:hypothetical protein